MPGYLLEARGSTCCRSTRTCSAPPKTSRPNPKCQPVTVLESTLWPPPVDATASALQRPGIRSLQPATGGQRHSPKHILTLDSDPTSVSSKWRSSSPGDGCSEGPQQAPCS
eukprot:scaffold203_cov386-Prasinococcus_capsulatus_cf.AAC.13